MKKPQFDEYGYPTETTLAAIRTWDYKDATGLMEFVIAAWKWADMGVIMKKLRAKNRYSISTGGWSGNEDIIDALAKNWKFWNLYWKSSKRGGHYIFEIDR